MKIAITGGAGFIGAALTHAYLEAGHDVLVIDNLQSGSVARIDRRARFYEMDIRERNLASLLTEERPEIVSHHALHQAYDLPGETALVDADIHVRGLLNVLESSVSANVHKVIFASSGNSLYASEVPTSPFFSEESPIAPQQAHDVSAIAGEWYVRYYSRNYGLPHTILRYADIYGEDAQMPLNHLHHPLSYFIRMFADQRRPIIRSPYEELHDHLFISDAVSANLSALSRGNNQTLHISSGVGTSLKELFHLTAELLHSELEPVFLSGALEEGHASILSNARAGQVLGWKPQIPLLEGLKRSIALLNIPLRLGEKAEVQVAQTVGKDLEQVLVRA